MANIKQKELENIYCGYVANIDLIKTLQAKQFEAYPKDIKVKSSIQKNNIEKTMKCMEYKAKVDESLKKIDPAYVPNCDKYKNVADLKKS